MDLITDLPTSKGFDSILVIVDHGLTKGVILVPCSKTLSAEGVGDLLFRYLLTRFGRPNKIISDRDPRFMADSFQEALRLMGIKSSPSTAFHPQTDGATERVNQEIEAYLSIFCSVNPETWSELLPLVEFTHNSRQHADRLHSPFELLYSYQPPVTK
jgi:transposase InsO family protein